MKKPPQLTFKRALELMRRSGTRMVKMHAKEGQVYYIIPGGTVDETIAHKIMDHPMVSGSKDGLFPNCEQTWRMG